MKKIISIFLGFAFILAFSGCSNSSNSSDSSKTGSDGDIPSEYEYDEQLGVLEGDYNGVIKELDGRNICYVSFWIDSKSSDKEGVGGYHYYVYPAADKKYETRIKVQRVEGAAKWITVTDNNIHYDIDINLISNNGGNSYYGSFLVESKTYIGTIIKKDIGNSETEDDTPVQTEPEETSADETWGAITNKSDLIGEWGAFFSDSSTAITASNTLVIYSDYSGYLGVVYDFSKASSEQKAYMASYVELLKKKGVFMYN